MTYPHAPGWECGVRVLCAKRPEVSDGVRSDKGRIRRGEHSQRKRCEVAVHGEKRREDSGLWLGDEL